MSYEEKTTLRHCGPSNQSANRLDNHYKNFTDSRRPG
jgi:hypothetical protein